jgi:phosphate uptake regulator
MEIRRVQITGGSSYVLTLPKEWIKTANIKKNDPVGIFIQSDGTLLITSKMTQEKLHSTKEFDVQKIKKSDELLRQLIGAYIAGYTTLRITSPTRIPLTAQNTIRSFTQLAIGPEVIEETDTSITLKDLLNPTEMPLDKTIKRMHIIVKGMNEDALRALQSGDASLASDVISRDNDIDRLHWFVSRQYNIILQNISLAEKMEITIGMTTACFLISRIIERIGDHVVRIAQNIPSLIDSRLDQKIINRIISADTLAIEIFNKSISAFFRKDIKASNEIMDLVINLEKLCEEINTLALQQKSIVALSIGYLIESIRRIGEYAEDISENVINYLVGETK